MDIVRRLKRAYPQAAIALDFTDPLELLVATILSAQCTDARVNIVTRDLFRRYRTAADYAKARQSVLEKEIRSTGFFRNKAKHIIAAAKMIVREHQGKVPETMDQLLALPGVARKTANIVLYNAFGRNEGIAVDTHVKRLSRRLGLTKNENPNKIEKDLMEQVPRKDWGELNHLLTTHGRRVCQARKPRCPECPLARLCPSRVKS